MIDKDYLLDDMLLDSYENYSLRQEALEHYERALLIHHVTPFQQFVETQLVSNPFHLFLFYDLANDLQQQLISLQEHLLDSRKRVIQVISQVYQTDISHLIPLEQPERYTLLSVEGLVGEIRKQGVELFEEERRVLKEMAQTTVQNFAQINSDIQLTNDLLDLLHDWLNAASLINLRQTQIPNWSDLTDGLSKIH